MIRLKRKLFLKNTHLLSPQTPKCEQFAKWIADNVLPPKESQVTIIGKKKMRKDIVVSCAMTISEIS